jgi:hypothetical protein
LTKRTRTLRKKQLRKQMRERERETRVLTRKVAKRLLGNTGWVTLPPIGQYPVEEITESFWYGSEKIIYRRSDGKA